LTAAVALALAHLELADGVGLHFGPHPTVVELERFEQRVQAAIPLYRNLSGYRVAFVDVWADAAFESRFHKTNWDNLRGPRASRYCQATGYFGMHPNFFSRYARAHGYRPPERNPGETTQDHALRITAYMRQDLDREIAVHARGMADCLRIGKGDYPVAVSYYRHGYTGAKDSNETAAAYYLRANGGDVSRFFSIWRWGYPTETTYAARCARIWRDRFGTYPPTGRLRKP
jgi:hypothetical protein